jgi:hypothetical protein
MKTEYTVKKVKCTQELIGQDILIPDSEESQEVIKSLPYGKKMYNQTVYNAKHNIERHDLFHACVKLIADNTGRDKVEIKEKCKLDCRHIEGYVTYLDKNGKSRVNVTTKSIAFSKMNIQEANEFYSKAFHVLARELNITTDKLIDEAKLRMKTKHYCLLCGKPATHKHHRFSQTKWAIEKYGRKLIDDEKNIEWLCHDCHSSHNKIPAELIWSEKKFCEALGITQNSTKDKIVNIFDGKEV